MNLMDGKQVAADILCSLTNRVEHLKQLGITPTLGILLVGNDPRSKTYVHAKQRAAEKLGIAVRLDERAFANATEVFDQIQAWNQDSDVHGIIIQLPLPADLASNELHFVEAVLPTKDVDGLHPTNLGRLLRGAPQVIPATPRGVMALLAQYAVSVDGANVTLIGFGKLVGRALATLLLQSGATLTVATSHTRDLAAVTKQADIVISAAGKANLVTADMIKPDAVLVDVGLSELDERIVGDVSPEARNQARLATPVPGGVGPMTVAMLLTNVVEAAERSQR